MTNGITGQSRQVADRGRHSDRRRVRRSMVPLASGLACVVASALLAGCAGNVGGGTATTASNQPTQALAPQAVPPQASGAQALAPQSLAPQTLPPQATGSRPANTATASLQPTAIPAGARPSVGQPPIQDSGQQTGNSPHRVVHVATAALPPAPSTQPPRAPIVFAATAPASKPLPQSRSTRAAAVPTQSPPPVARLRSPTLSRPRSPSRFWDLQSSRQSPP